MFFLPIFNYPCYERLRAKNTLAKSLSISLFTKHRALVHLSRQSFLVFKSLRKMLIVLGWRQLEFLNLYAIFTGDYMTHVAYCFTDNHNCMRIHWNLYANSLNTQRQKQV